jgi:hypothetical protein|eukprot:COSAG06_NODE_9921_length_1789_cov_2.199408_1_plen_82_part_00
MPRQAWDRREDCLKSGRFAQAKSGATTEMIDFGGGFSKPILTFDGAAVGEGKPGPVPCLLKKEKNTLVSIVSFDTTSNRLI